MELIPYKEFARLRLSQFYPKPTEIEQLHDWEFMDHIWIGEAVGFTEWLRLEEFPDELASMSLELGELPKQVVMAVLDAIHLPLKPHMSFLEITPVLGTPTESRMISRVGPSSLTTFHVRSTSQVV